MCQEPSQPGLREQLRGTGRAGVTGRCWGQGVRGQGVRGQGVLFRGPACPCSRAAGSAPLRRAAGRSLAVPAEVSLSLCRAEPGTGALMNGAGLEVIDDPGSDSSGAGVPWVSDPALAC